MRMPPGRSPSQNRIGRSFLNLGTLSPSPWDLPPYRQNGCSRWGGWRRPAHSGRWVGAPVASLRCRILRPGEVSINRVKRSEKKKLLERSQVG
jgi:hypothetical protein